MSGSELDTELEAFFKTARAAVNAADPPPSEVSQLAKLAYEFRSVETYDFHGEPELAGVRSSSEHVTLQASKDDTTVIWTLGPLRISGVIHAPSLTQVTLQTTIDSVTISVDAADGSFEIDAPNGPYRLVIRSESSDWATPWTIS